MTKLDTKRLVDERNEASIKKVNCLDFNLTDDGISEQAWRPCEVAPHHGELSFILSICIYQCYKLP